MSRPAGATWGSAGTFGDSGNPCAARSSTDLVDPGIGGDRAAREQRDRPAVRPQPGQDLEQRPGPAAGVVRRGQGIRPDILRLFRIASEHDVRDRLFAILEAHGLGLFDPGQRQLGQRAFRFGITAAHIAVSAGKPHLFDILRPRRRSVERVAQILPAAGPELGPEHHPPLVDRHGVTHAFDAGIGLGEGVRAQPRAIAPVLDHRCHGIKQPEQADRRWPRWRTCRR